MASFSMLFCSRFCFLVLVLQSIYCANITVQPVSINTTLNSTVIFTCEAIADVITFRVNDESANHIDVKNKGFIETTFGNDTLRGELEATAYDFNNNTNIRCRASNDDPHPGTVVYSDASLLLIQGLLASVGNLTVAYINESSVLLSWAAPYTLDNVPITGYYINDTSDRMLNTTDLSYILFSPDPACDITTVTVSAVNGAGIGQPANTSFYYKRDFLGPVINSSIDNCSNISITWDGPKVDGCTESIASIKYYLLTIYDNITGNMVDIYTVYGTSYQYEDTDLFHHRYTYIITGVNELGEGISNDNTFSYQRVPRSATESTFEILNYTQNNATIKFNIPVTLECTGEISENATITIECNGTEIFTDTYLMEYAKQPRNITGSVLVPQNQECILSVVFSNQVGSSKPFTLTFNTTPSITISPSPTSSPSPASSPSPTSSPSSTSPSPNSNSTSSSVIIGTVSDVSVIILSLAFSLFIVL